MNGPKMRWNAINLNANESRNGNGWVDVWTCHQLMDELIFHPKWLPLDKCPHFAITWVTFCWILWKVGEGWLTTHSPRDLFRILFSSKMMAMLYVALGAGGRHLSSADVNVPWEKEMAIKVVLSSLARYSNYLLKRRSIACHQLIVCNRWGPLQLNLLFNEPHFSTGLSFFERIVSLERTTSTIRQCLPSIEGAVRANPGHERMQGNGTLPCRFTRTLFN